MLIYIGGKCSATGFAYCLVQQTYDLCSVIRIFDDEYEYVEDGRNKQGDECRHVHHGYPSIWIVAAQLLICCCDSNNIYDFRYGRSKVWRRGETGNSCGNSIYTYLVCHHHSRGQTVIS